MQIHHGIIRCTYLQVLFNFCCCCFLFFFWFGAHSNNLSQINTLQEAQVPAHMSEKKRDELARSPFYFYVSRYWHKPNQDPGDVEPGQGSNLLAHRLTVSYINQYMERSPGLPRTPSSSVVGNGASAAERRAGRRMGTLRLSHHLWVLPRRQSLRSNGRPSSNPEDPLFSSLSNSLPSKEDSNEVLVRNPSHGYKIHFSCARQNLMIPSLNWGSCRQVLIRNRWGMGGLGNLSADKVSVIHLSRACPLFFF